MYLESTEGDLFPMPTEIALREIVYSASGVKGGIFDLPLFASTSIDGNRTPLNTFVLFPRVFGGDIEHPCSSGTSVYICKHDPQNIIKGTINDIQQLIIDWGSLTK